ncbi:MAG: deoxyuridine 5'-triphosphate nucleotidohydrolase [Peptococcaceae bacterium]|nr:deoxyuridine 5'-triphosphate nucleotidohydrolase [Peptococcaceae bacterium]
MITFEKISWPQFLEDWRHRNEERPEQVADVYGEIRLPRRATVGAAGYDFFAPYAFNLHPGEQLTILTGIRACMPKNVVLVLAPRSGQGVRYKLQLMNTLGIIDSDYQYADNEGHIMITLFNDHPDKHAILKVGKGQAFAQGIFLPYLITDDDYVVTERKGGFGSTDIKNA